MNLRDIARTAWTEKSNSTDDTDECWQAAIEAVLETVGSGVRFYAGPIIKDLIIKMGKEDL